MTIRIGTVGSLTNADITARRVIHLGRGLTGRLRAMWPVKGRIVLELEHAAGVEVTTEPLPADRPIYIETTTNTKTHKGVSA